ncbi:MAG TPA: hypothetical protein VF265_10420 [Nevskiaceae bacterium]
MNIIDTTVTLVRRNAAVAYRRSRRPTLRSVVSRIAPVPERVPSVAQDTVGATEMLGPPAWGERAFANLHRDLQGDPLALGVLAKLEGDDRCGVIWSAVIGRTDEPHRYHAAYDLLFHVAAYAKGVPPVVTANHRLRAERIAALARALQEELSQPPFNCTGPTAYDVELGFTSAYRSLSNELGELTAMVEKWGAADPRATQANDPVTTAHYFQQRMTDYCRQAYGQPLDALVTSLSGTLFGEVVSNTATARVAT